MFDTLAVAQQLARGGVARGQAEAIAGAIHEAVQQGDSVTADQFKAGVAELRTEIAGLDKRLSAEIAGVRTDVANLDKRLSAEIAGVRTDVANLDKRLSAEIAGVRTDVANLDKRLSAEIAGVRTDVANLDKRLATQIATVETRLLRWMVGAVFAAASLSGGILAALLRLAG